MELVTAAANGVVDQAMTIQHFRLVQVGTITQLSLVYTVAGVARQGRNLFGGAGTDGAATRVNRVIAGPRVRADTPAHFFNVRTQPLGQVCHFVHEADLRGQHGVSGVLGRL